MVWCNDSKSTNYNKEIKINKKFKYEKIFRNDYKYDYFILVKYNYFKPKKKRKCYFYSSYKELQTNCGMYCFI